MTSRPTEWTCAATEVSGLRGQTFYLVRPDDLPVVEKPLTAAGYELRAAQGTADVKTTMTAICRALRVPLASNLDSFADVLRDLEPSPAGNRVGLVWLGSDLLAAADLAGWLEVAEILTGASADHWDPENDADPDNLVFETFAVTAGFGVRPVR